MGYLKTTSKVAKLEAEILEQYGEISEEQSEELELLQNQIEKDRDNAFRWLRSQRPKEIEEQIKDRIGELKKEIESLHRIKGAMEHRLYDFLEDKDFFEVKDENGNVEFFVKKDMSDRRKIDPEKIEDEKISEKIELVVNKESAQALKTLLETEGYNDYKVDLVYPTVTQLPDDHKAIIHELTPKIKFVKNKPKVK